MHRLIRDDLPILYLDDAVCLQRHTFIMGDHEDGLSILAVGQFQQGDDLLRILPVKVPCRLVRQQDRGLVDQGAPDCRPLLLSPGKLPRQVFQPVPSPNVLTMSSNRSLPGSLLSKSMGRQMFFSTLSVGIRL